MVKCRSIPKRWIIVIQCLFVVLFCFAIRLSFSVAIVCMVKQTPQNSSSSAQPTTLNNSLNGNYDWDLNSVPSKNLTLHGCGYSSTDTEIWTGGGEFEWSKTTQADLLSAVSYGYISTQILGGWLARRYGTRIVLGICLIGMNICCLITPLAARWSVYLLFSVRVAMGMCMGSSLPGMYNILSRWAPPLQRSLFISVACSGFAVGHMLAFGASGFLCSYAGWPSIFYVFGGLSMLWLVTWPYTVYDRPAAHPRISEEEKVYLETLLHTGVAQEKDIPTPWCSILTSAPFWGNAMAFFADDWVNYTLQLGQIVYMQEVLHYNISENGLLSGLPPLGSFIMGFFTGYFADLFQRKGLMNTLNTRRFFQLRTFLWEKYCDNNKDGLSLHHSAGILYNLEKAFVPMGIFIIAAGYITCEDRVWAVVFLTVARIIYAFCKGGFPVSPVDFAPRYCSEMVGILNSIGTVTGFLSPIVIAVLTPNGTQQEWLIVFYVAGSIAILGSLGFCVLARGEVQKWAIVMEHEVELEEKMLDVEKVT